MIINREIRPAWDFNANKQCNQLVISYVDNTGEIKFMTYNITDNDMFEWDYAKSQMQADPNFMSWDMKPVRRAKTKKELSKERIYQILFDLNVNKQIDSIFDLNYPNTYFWDIENDITEDGHIDPTNAIMPITVMSWVRYPYVTVLGTKPLTAEQIQQTQKDIDEHCENFDSKPKYIFQYVYYDTEVKMLYDFINNYVPKAAAISGWNIWGYDIIYLMDRCKRLGIDITPIAPTGSFTTIKNSNGDIVKVPRHRLIYDYLACYKKWDRTVKVKENNTLDFVGEATCGVRKVQHKLGLKEMWEQQPREYIFYNAIDSILVEQIDKKIKTSKSMYGLAQLTKAEILECFGTIASVEIVQNEYLYKEKKVVPISTKKIDFREYEGAFVFKPEASISKWVLGLDYASLYPSTIIQFNLSPETYMFKDKSYAQKANEIKTASGTVFTKNIEGFMPRMLSYYYSERKRHKRESGNAYSIASELEKIYNERTKNNS